MAMVRTVARTIIFLLVVVADYGREHERAVACFIDIEACIAHLRIPVTHRRPIRTTNLPERLFVEERRRLKIIPNAFGEKAVIKLMFGALARAAERWRSVKVAEFERRQLTPASRSTRNIPRHACGLRAVRHARVRS
jgi:mutator family transposase